MECCNSYYCSDNIGMGVMTSKRGRHKKRTRQNPVTSIQSFSAPESRGTKHIWDIRIVYRRTVFRYGVAFFAPFIIFLFTSYFSHYFNQHYSFLFFATTIVLSAWYGGFWPGIVATFLSIGFIDAFFLTPGHVFFGRSFEQDIYIILFLLQGILISIISQALHTALKNANKQKAKLARSEEYFRLIVETVKDYAIFATDTEGYITSWNEGAKRLTGFTEKEIIGKHFSIFYLPKEVGLEKPWKDLNAAAIKGRYEEEKPRLKKNGTLYFAGSVITAVKDSENKLYGFSHIISDMTKHRELDRRKDEFIAIASHELKTPLTSIKILNDLLLRIYPKTSKNYLTKMEEQIDRLTELINTLLDANKIQAGKLTFKKERFDLSILLSDTVENFRRLSKNHRVIIEGNRACFITGDKDRISQILVNFLTNAIKYSPGGGDVVIKIIYAKAMVTVAVRDKGIGIEEKDREKIFTRFYRVGDIANKFSGLGIGLYIAAQIVRQHGGSIGVESEKGKGSTFYFSLPYHQ